MTTTKANYQIRTYGEALKDTTDNFNTKKEAISFMKRMYDFMIEMEAQTFSLNKVDWEDGESYLTEINTQYTIHNY